MIELRPYQDDLVAAVEDHDRPLIVLPTGAGKTLVASEIIRRSSGPVLFVAHRRELVHQAAAKLADFDVDAGVILAGQEGAADARVQVASIQTLWFRCFLHKQPRPAADLVFIDEAHHAAAETYRRLVASYPGAKVIGMTATPCRRDGRGLGNIFSAIVEGPQVAELIDAGYLVKTKVFAPSVPDLRGVKTRAGDYVESQLAEAMDRSELVGDIVTHWHRLAERRKTVVFATSVAHSIHLRDEFAKSGVKAAQIDGGTPKEERDQILRRLSAGDLELVSNCMVLTEGWDQPDVSCCILARPTRSAGLFRQMAGRVIRPAPGKDDALILDHAGAVFQHGFVEDRMVWVLSEDSKAFSPAQRSRKNRPAHRLLACPECQAIRTAGKPCDNCGFMPKPRGEYLPTRDGVLAHVDHRGIHAVSYSLEQRQELHRMLLYIALERGYKPGWAAYKYKERFGGWPPYGAIEPLPPSPEVRAWVRSRQIAYARAREVGNG